MQDHDAILIEGNSETNMDLYYATKFWTPCPMIYVQTKKEKIMLITDFELERAKKEAEVDRVLCKEEYGKKPEPELRTELYLDATDMILKEIGAKRLLVPEYFAVKIYDFLTKKRDYEIGYKDDPFFEERAIKTKEEISHITDVLRQVEGLYHEIVQLLRDSEIRDDFIYYKGEKLTSEYIKKMINVELMKKGITAQDTIVACGNDAADPHGQGSGPLRANEPIVIDIFPRSGKTSYYADMTRTFVKGKASKELKKIYNAVKGAQEFALGMIKEGVYCNDVYDAVLDYFEKNGYKSGKIDGREQGFTHGVGHGLGLCLHEPPALRKTYKHPLKAGNVVTVEPGLYYFNRGSTRIEDLVVVTKDGCKNLTKFPKELEIP